MKTFNYRLILVLLLLLQSLLHHGTKEVDLGGKIVVPGFIDSHVHLIFGGLQVHRQFHSDLALFICIAQLPLVLRFRMDYHKDVV